ncbi:MAG TPA: c-type cytochrome [Methylomirabilota bacterium]|nr:c-type cytochrome [Methylomirabilota bacterium]
MRAGWASLLIGGSVAAAGLSPAWLALAWLTPARADSARGERIFQRCFACHSVVAGEDKLPGPNLRTVVGRRAGTWPGFRFSPALSEAGKTRGLVWTREALEAYLADPERFVPGTEMGSTGLREADDWRDVIDYLERVGRGSGSTPGRTP